jgi:hypothetical protein
MMRGARVTSAHTPEILVNRLEYKTILLPYKPSVFQSDDTELSTALNAEAQDRWRLAQIILPSTIWGRANGMMAILERTTS